jgi:hypothetical protein
MSFTRTLVAVVTLLALLTLSGCGQLLRSNTVAVSPPMRMTELQSLNHWLDISQQVEAMTTEQATVALRGLGRLDSDSKRFYYGALNQKLGRFDGWIQARDTFRRLANDNALEPSVRELARILLAHNQALINWHERHRHLQRELAESVLDRELLEQKIEALTDLEAVISQQKQQVIDDGKLKALD